MKNQFKHDIGDEVVYAGMSRVVLDRLVVRPYNRLYKIEGYDRVKELSIGTKIYRLEATDEFIETNWIIEPYIGKF